MHNNPEEYNSYQRSQDMRNKTDKKKATQKMIDTKVKTGQIVNPKNLTWKQFWKKCNRIVFKKRKDLLKSWNGYDYLDGEYIYKYLDLPYFHKNYPTLDHIIPKQKFFLSGKSPEEACRDENLGWTKRTNNSRKHVKEHGVFLQEISDLTGTTD